jgi:Tfp pilus assembly protein PilN
MINLLPIENKHQIIYGRKNRSLLNWIIALLILLLILLIVTIVGVYYIDRREKSLNRLIEISNQRVEGQDLKEFQKKAEVFSNDLNVAVKLLEKQLLFSKLIKTTGSTLPQGVVLSNLDYNAEDEVLTLNIIGNNQQDITTAFNNINISKDTNNSLFSKADLVSVNCNFEENECNGSIVALLNKSSDFYLFNSAIPEKDNKQQ